MVLYDEMVLNGGVWGEKVYIIHTYGKMMMMMVDGKASYLQQ